MHPLVSLLHCIPFGLSGLGAGEPANPPRCDVDHVTFGADGVSLAERFELRLVAVGREGAVAPLPQGECLPGDELVEYRRAEVVEWFREDSRGLEQGFTLPRPPACDAAQGSRLELVIAFEGASTASIAADGRSARLRSRDGESELVYTGLWACDALGRELGAELALGSRAASEVVLRILVDDHGAQYPLTIDPWLILEEISLSPAVPYDSSSVGRSVSIDGDAILAGAGTSHSFGIALVYRRLPSGWVEEDVITGPTNSAFGSGVDMQGERALIGAWSYQNPAPNIGLARVYERTPQGSWEFAASLQPAPATGARYVGWAVALEGNTALLGAPGSDSAAGPFTGSAFAYTFDGASWTLQAQLVATDADLEDFFGASVALKGDVAIVGAPQADDDAGAAYVFRRSGSIWNEEQRLPGTGEFGFSVALDGGILVIGAPGAGIATTYHEEAGSWVQDQVLAPGGSATNFGIAVSIEGDYLVVGQSLSEAAWFYVRSTGGAWELQASLPAQPEHGGGYYGSAVAVEQGPPVRVAVGRPNFTVTGTVIATTLGDPVTSYCFGDGSGTACPCSNAGATGEGCRNSQGHGGVVEHVGSNSVAADDLRFRAFQLPPGQSALLYVGDRRVNDGDGAVFGDGLRCAQQGVVRLGVRQINAGGVAFWNPGLAQQGGWTAGDKRRFQVWYRDPNGGPCASGFNLTNALEVTFAE